MAVTGDSSGCGRAVVPGRARDHVRHDLAWLYNIITNLAQQPIQDAITREVASQVRAKTFRRSSTCLSKYSSGPVAIPVNAHFPKIAQCRRNCVKAEMRMLL